jgi:membrane fusion protein, multidrug efflux system
MSSRRVVGRSWCSLAAALTLSAAAAAWAQEKKEESPAGPPQGPPPALVRVAEVQQQKVQSKLDVVGRLQEVRRAVVAAEQEGRIVAVPVEEGSAVDGNKTVIAKIDDTWMKLATENARARLAVADATVKEAQARYEQMTRQYTQLKELGTTGAAKPKEVEDARNIAEASAAMLDAAKAAIAVAQAEVARAKEYENRIAITAPFDGVVVKKMTEVGQWVTPGTAVAEIISRGQIDAVVDVPERLVNNVTVGDEVEVRIEPLHATVTGKAAAINPMGATAARTFPVKIRMDDQGGKLKPGMSVLASVPTGQEVEALTVPRDAVHRTMQGTVVWTNANGTAAPVPVRVLFGQGDRYAIESAPGGPPLQAGARVVIEGAERLFPGRPLIVVPSGSPEQQSVAK